jgi:hypothetical protein
MRSDPRKCVLIIATACWYLLGAQDSLSPGGRVLGDSIDPQGLLEEAVNHTGGVAIRTAEIHFRASIVDAPPTSEDINKRVADQEAALRDAIRTHGQDADFVRRIEKALETNRQDVTPQVIANAKREIRGLYLVGGPHFGGDRLTEVRLRRGSNPEWDPPLILLTRHLDRGSQRTILFDAANRSAIASTDPVQLGVPEPHVFGRFLGNVLVASYGRTEYESVIRNPEELPHEVIQVTAEIIQQSDEKDANGILLELSVERLGGKNKVANILIDPTRDYICPLIEEFDQDGKLIRDFRSSDYFHDSSSGVWFPGRCKTRRSILDRTGEFSVVDYEFDSIKSRFNIDLSVEQFSISLPVGTSVFRRTGENQQQWVVKCDYTATIDQIESIETSECIGTSADDVTMKRPNIERKSALRGTLVLINLAAGCAIVSYLAYRKLKNGKVRCFWISLGACGCTVISGCSNTTSGAFYHLKQKPECFANPATVNMGTISANGQVVKSVVTFFNSLNEEAIVLKLSSGCGCTVLENDEVTINPHSDITVPLSVSTYGRNGSFKTEIGCKWYSKCSERSGEVRVPLVAKFIQNIFATPTRLFLHDSESRLVVETCFSITAPEEVWPSLNVAASIANAEIAALPSEKTDANVRQFRLTAPDRASTSGLVIAVTLKGQESPVLSIPVLRGTGKSISGN